MILAMGIFLIKRFATFVATLLAASVVVFAVQGVLPGNAAQVMLGESATPEAVAALSHKLGLDPPACATAAGSPASCVAISAPACRTTCRSPG
jgi:ABC-type dipeptide/oligopeptide/nickel transport system permease component